MTEPIEQLADALVVLSNSRPRTPTREEFIECILRHRQIPNTQVVANQHGDVYFVAGDFDDLQVVRTWGAFP